MSKTRDVKVVILGDAGVGKTSILNRFSNKKFDENSQTTLGASFIPKVIQKGDKTYKFQIWDTAGQEKYRSLAPLYYRDSHAALIVYDITNKASFEVLRKWVDELREHGPANICNYDCEIAVVGNKVDLIDREDVKYDDAKNYANGLHALFQYTSAKENQNIESLFIQLAEKVEEKDQVQKPVGSKGVDISKTQTNQGNGGSDGCCSKN